MRRLRVAKDEIERFGLAGGDLLFARRSLVAEGAGKCSIVCEVNEPTVFESSIIRARPDTSKADSLFLYYFFNSPQGKSSLDSILRHVAVAGITGSDLVKLLVPCPPLYEQKAIARILGTLDDKIELNRKMNETLEQMARATFKSWFVDFEPFRDEGTADSPLGKIPKGWSVAPISDLCTLQRDSLQPSDNPEEVFAHYSIPAYDEGRLPKLELGIGILSNKLTVPENVVLLSKLNPRFPRVWLPDISGTLRSICSTEFLVVRPDRTVSREFRVFWFSSG
jgi:type I restriction enzyme S subunit